VHTLQRVTAAVRLQPFARSTSAFEISRAMATKGMNA
jgi:hypothetical protein